MKDLFKQLVTDHHGAFWTRYVTDPETGKMYPVPAGGSDDPPADPPSDPPADDPPADDPPSDPDPTPLEQQALDAIDQLKQAGTEIPEALNAVVKEFRDARKEAGNHRTAKSAEKERADAAEGKLSQVLELLGIKNDDDPDPEALQAAIGERDSKLTAKTVEFDAYRAAAKVIDPKVAPSGVNPDALLDSASFLKKAAELDPTSDSYKADLESAIKNAVEGNPLLAASPGGGRGRGPNQGPRQTPDSAAPASLEDAYAAHYQ